MPLDSLKRFLQNNSIPVVENKVGFLEIIRKQHHENINSNLYAHFINSSNESVRTLFVDALLELVYNKTGKRFSMPEVYASTEVNTGKGRIDIVIMGNQDKDIILIENKIYHCLNNDLLDYWQFFKIDDSKKVGVLLTLHNHQIPSDVIGKFINITHFDWARLIERNLASIDLPVNYAVYINDFINTIKNLTTTYEMNESTKFYFEHSEQIVKAQQTIHEAHKFINEQLELIANTIGWQTYGNSMNWRNLWDAHNKLDTYLTIITKDLLEGRKSFTIILELNREDKLKENEVAKLLENHPQKLSKKRGNSQGSYVHFLYKSYPITFEELENFAEIVVEHIRKDFADMTLKVIRLLYEGKDISNWERKFLGVEEEIEDFI